MKCGPVTSALCLRSGFLGEIINIRLQDSGMLEGMLRFLLELFFFFFDPLILTLSVWLGRDFMGKSESFRFNIYASKYLLMELKEFF